MFDLEPVSDTELDAVYRIVDIAVDAFVIPPVDDDLICITVVI